MDNICSNGASTSGSDTSDLQAWVESRGVAENLLILSGDAVFSPQFNFNRIVEHSLIRGTDTVTFVVSSQPDPEASVLSERIWFGQKRKLQNINNGVQDSPFAKRSKSQRGKKNIAFQQCMMSIDSWQNRRPLRSTIQTVPLQQTLALDPLDFLRSCSQSVQIRELSSEVVSQGQNAHTKNNSTSLAYASTSQLN